MDDHWGLSSTLGSPLSIVSPQGSTPMMLYSFHGNSNLLPCSVGIKDFAKIGEILWHSNFLHMTHPFVAVLILCVNAQSHIFNGTTMSI